MKKGIILALLLLPLIVWQLTSTASSTHSMDDYRLKTVVIDAGHGGKDSGCLGANSKEKVIALGVSLKLGEYISKNFPDVKVIYTRKTDKFLELKERAEIANSNNADLFISVHCNASPSKQGYGTETYVMGTHRSNANLMVAKRENSVVTMEDNYEVAYDGFDPNSDEGHIRLSIFQNAYREESILFASLVEDQFQKKAKRSSRGVKEAGFLVLYKTTMPSVLIETGFLTNTSEEKYLMTAEGQDKIASSIYKAFAQFKEIIDGSLD